MSKSSIRLSDFNFEERHLERYLFLRGRYQYLIDMGQYTMEYHIDSFLSAYEIVSVSIYGDGISNSYMVTMKEKEK